MHPFALTRFQLILIAVALAFFTGGGVAVAHDHDVIGVGLWQVAVLAGVGVIAAGNVRWIIANLLAETDHQRTALHEHLEVDVEQLRAMVAPDGPSGPHRIRG